MFIACSLPVHGCPFCKEHFYYWVQMFFDHKNVAKQLHMTLLFVSIYAKQNR